MIYGTFGIGKSFVIRQVAKEIAEVKGREFVEWNKINYEKKKEIIINPNKYFVLIDIRLSEYDSSDVKGLPDFKDENIIWKSPYWTKILELPESDGFLFFDEMNLATPLVLSSCYKIIYDRIINEGSISPNWLIISAGNLVDDKAYTNEIPYPLRDRCGEVELLEPNHDIWINWAIENDLDYRIIGFINFSPSKLRVVNTDDTQKSTTPRSWERVNALIKGVEEYPKLELVVGTALGEGIAREFIAFCKIKDEVQLDKVLQFPQELKKVTEISTKYFVISAVAEHYGKGNKVDFKKLLDISQVLDEMNSAEFITLMWRLAVKYNPTKFRKDFQSKELDSPLRAKYNKYLMPNM
jgi:hypothetical protein